MGMGPRLNLNPQSDERRCTNCQKRIAKSSKYDMCNDCLKSTLYPEVKEFILNNNVTELDIAEHFGIDKMLVKEWVRDGLIAHKRYPKYSDTDY